AGRHRVVETRLEASGEGLVRVLLREHEPVPEGPAHLAFAPEFTHLYVDGWLAGRAPAGVLG
ncbi:MAG TPA: hypothetical protein VEB41_07350, partial [Burkholderiales bacterium]|nr:hypothetical protein [Burkholderiales bacterium]